MTSRLLTIPLIATLATAAAALRQGTLEVREAPVDSAWSSTGFAERIGRALDRARAELAEDPAVAWIRCELRSRDPHEPLKVDVRLAWASVEAPSAEALRRLAIIIRDWLEDVAEVVIVVADDRGRTVTP